MYPITDTQPKNLYTLKKIRIQMEINACKDFHIFAFMSVIKTCVTCLILKDKDVQHWKPFSFSSQITLTSLW